MRRGEQGDIGRYVLSCLSMLQGTSHRITAYGMGTGSKGTLTPFQASMNLDSAAEGTARRLVTLPDSLGIRRWTRVCTPVNLVQRAVRLRGN